MSCGYNCEYSCEECDVPDKVIEFVNGYNQALEDMAHNLKETFNNEFPSNYHCTQPYFTLDNARVLTDAVKKELTK